MSNQVLIEIFNPIENENQNRRLSRKLALLCYFLNTRLDCNLQFVHGGVFVRPFTLDYKVGNNQTQYEVVVNQKHVVSNATYLDDENVTEDDFRGFSQHFIETLGGISQDFTNFRNYKFVNYQPIIVGRHYIKESNIDGRHLNNYSSGGIVHQTHYNTISANPGQVVHQTYSNNIGGSQYYSNNLGGSQYHQMSGSQYVQQPQQYVQVQPQQYVSNNSTNQYVNNSSTQQISNTSLNKNTSFNGSVNAKVNVNNSSAGRKTVINVGNVSGLNNDSVNAPNAFKRNSVV